MTAVLDTLIKARELIAKPGGWTQGAYGRDSSGNMVHLRQIWKAVCFCPMGAIEFVNPALFDSACDALCLQIRRSEIDDWNDASVRKQADVVEAYDRAIAAERAKVPA